MVPGGFGDGRFAHLAAPAEARVHRSQAFPSLMFFEHREATTVHKRLDFILLFILRTIMLLLLALLFANPFIRTSTPIGRGEKLVVRRG